MTGMSSGRPSESPLALPQDTGASSGPVFHPRCGQLVTLSQGNRTASRSHATQEFNHGLVFSANPLQDNQMVEVRIDKKIHSWSGSIEMGITQCNPNMLDVPFPSSATELREGTWIMSGNSILKDGRSINENYGTDLDKLEEGDKVGVLKTAQGDLLFFVNGVSQGVAAANIPGHVFAVIDMYGKCAQVSLTDNSVQEARILCNDQSNVATAAAALNTHLNSLTCNNSHNNMTNTNIQAATAAANAAVAAATLSGIAIASSSGLVGGVPAGNNYNNNKIRFHERHGSLIKLLNNNRTAERKRPFDEFNNGVVMTHRPIKDNELFEIRLDRLVDKWSGSIEVGLTTHNPAQLDFPATMTNLRAGTTMMSGCGILTNGKGTRREYGQFNLDELAEGDRIGMIRKSNGNLHYFINGLDQGVAASRLPAQTWGVVDLYGMTVKVTLVDRDERDEQNLITRRALALRPNHELDILQNDDRLMFHVACGSHAAVINTGLTAHRPNAEDDFNFGVVLTSRPMKDNEVFEVRLDKMVTKWAGSIEIGVTTHAPCELEFPSTMTNVRSGTWMMTGNGVMHNGTTTIDAYGQNLDKLKVGDRVGVMRKDSGVLHFYVNGEDQGPAATNVPERTYGVIDLYGQAAQATIIDLSDYRSPDGLDSNATSATLFSHMEASTDLRFHHLHGRNARISNTGLTASRPNALSEFNDAIVMSNRPLKDGELFEIQLERMVERWSGSIEAGVTMIRPEDLDFPNTMTDIDYDTWMLSGSSVMRDGQTIRNGYSCDLDSLSVGSRLGMMRAKDGSLHYTINGVDQGVAMDSVPSGVFAVIDLYGVCAQASVVYTPGPRHVLGQVENSLASSQVMESSQVSIQLGPETVLHKFSAKTGVNIELSGGCMTASRKRSPTQALVFSAHALEVDELFEVKIDEVDVMFSGGIKVGLTTFNVNASEATKISQDLSKLSDSWWLEGSSVLRNGQVIKQNYGPCLERLSVGDKVGVKRTQDGAMKIVINGEDVGAACSGLCAVGIRAVISLSGTIVGVSVTSSHKVFSPQEESQASHLPDSLYSILEKEGGGESSDPPNTFEFHDNKGRNIALCHSNSMAKRNDSYNQGIVVSARPLPRNTLFQVLISHMTPRWSSSLSLGVTGLSPDKVHLPVSLLHLKRETWIISGDGVYHNGSKIKNRYGPNINSLLAGHTLGVLVDGHHRLHLYVNGVDQGVACSDIPPTVWVVFDLYGKCDEIVVNSSVGEVSNEEAFVKETGVKEEKENKNLMTSSQKMEMILPQQISRNCEYLTLCTKFKDTLGLPKFFFDLSQITCFCETCHKLRHEDVIQIHGDPKKKYALPIGWVKFPFKQHHQKEGSGNSHVDGEMWHVAYHGTDPGWVRRMLDTGKLLTKAEIGLERRRAPAAKSKEDDSDISLLYFSPTINYAGLERFSPSKKFTDKKNQRGYMGRVALQVAVEPGSYKVGESQDMEGVNRFESGLDIKEREWVSKERGNTTLMALLVKIE